MEEAKVIDGVTLSTEYKARMKPEAWRMLEAITCQIDRIIDELRELKKQRNYYQYKSDEYVSFTSDIAALSLKISDLKVERDKLYQNKDNYDVDTMIELKIAREQKMDEKNANVGRKVGTGLSRSSRLDGLGICRLDDQGKTFRTGSSRERARQRKRERGQKDASLRASMRGASGGGGKKGK